MDIKIEQIKAPAMEQVVIYCYEIDEQVNDLVSFIRNRSADLTGYQNAKSIPIQLSDIYYIEAVDNKVFAYLDHDVYEIKGRLYEFENTFQTGDFLRISKQAILNLMKVQTLKPALNGRFLAELKNGEHLIISRRYVPELKKRLRGE